MFRILLLALVLATPLSAAEPKKDNKTDKYFPIQTLRDQCVEFPQIILSEGGPDYGDCRVSDFGEFAKIGNQTYHYVLYCLIPSYSIKDGKCDSDNARFNRNRALAIFVQNDNDENARLLDRYYCTDIGMFVYDKPEIIKNAIGTILFVPIALDGTGHGNSSVYYIWQNEQWQIIESQKWVADLRKRLPSEFELWKGIWPDVKTMKAKAPLFRNGDYNCCPSGGTADITLSIENKQFIIKSIDIKSIDISSESMTKGHKR